MTLPDALSDLVRSPHDSAFVSDFDGTIAPIVRDPEAARALPEAVDALGALARRLGLVAVLSGRPVAFLRAQIPGDGVILVGQYGLERLVDGQIVVDPRAAPFVPAVEAAAVEAAERWPRLRIERKGEIACTLHWRAAPDAEPGSDDLAALAADHGLVAQPGRMACELRPPVPVDKGTAFRDLAAHAAHRAFAGDDHGDVAAFDVAFGAPDREERPVRIAVGSPEAPPALLERADLVVDGPAGLAALLADLAVAVSPRGRP